MILGHLDHSEKEGVFYPQIIQKGLRYLRDTDFSKVEDGKYPIADESIVASISEYFPEAKEKRKAETHTQYIDIQYMIRGQEIMGVSSIIDGIETPEGYLAETDATFYQTVNNETDVTLLQDMYVVFFPWDIHRPCCISQPGVKVRKVVLKLQVRDL